MKPRSLKLSHQNACDDGGFEEVSLDNSGSDFVRTPVNEFQEFNRSFPMMSSGRRKADRTANGGFSSSTSATDAGHLSLDMNRKVSLGHFGGRWATSTEEENEDKFDSRTPTNFDCSGSSPSTLSSLNDTNNNQSRSSSLLRTRTPSLVDELLSEIYARFGDMGSSASRRTLSMNGSVTGGGDSANSRRASQSGSPESDCLTEYSTTSEPCRRNPGHGRGMANSPTVTELARRDSQKKQKLRERGRRNGRGH